VQKRTSLEGEVVSLVKVLMLSLWRSLRTASFARLLLLLLLFVALGHDLLVSDCNEWLETINIYGNHNTNQNNLECRAIQSTLLGCMMPSSVRACITAISCST
jgi:hypothetical protein